MKDILVVIDAGHGVDTPGKRSPMKYNEYQLFEWEFNRIMQNKLARRFYEGGIKFEICPDTVYDTNLDDRVNFVNSVYNKNKALYNVIVLSLHGNAFGKESPYGSEVYTYEGQTESDVVAEFIAKQFEQSSLTKFRPDYADGDTDKEAKFNILGYTICPAVLVEFGFYTNDQEREKMLTNEWQEKMIALLYDAIQEYRYTY